MCKKTKKTIFSGIANHVSLKMPLMNRVVRTKVLCYTFRGVIHVTYECVMEKQNIVFFDIFSRVASQRRLKISKKHNISFFHNTSYVTLQDTYVWIRT